MIQLKQAAAKVEPKQGKKRQLQDLLNMEQRCFYYLVKSVKLMLAIGTS